MTDYIFLNLSDDYNYVKVLILNLGNGGQMEKTTLKGCKCNPNNVEVIDIKLLSGTCVWHEAFTI